jgi:hypothetical protein
VRAPLVVREGSVIDLATLREHVRDTAITGAATNSAKEWGKDVRAPISVDVGTLLIGVGANGWVIRALKKQLATATRSSIFA